MDDVLQGGRFDVVSIGFVLALWSGSRALNVFVDTISPSRTTTGRPARAGLPAARRLVGSHRRRTGLHITGDVRARDWLCRGDLQDISQATEPCHTRVLWSST